MLGFLPSEDNVDLSSYVENGEWELNYMTAEKILVAYETSNREYFQIIYEVTSNS